MYKFIPCDSEQVENIICEFNLYYLPFKTHYDLYVIKDGSDRSVAIIELNFNPNNIDIIYFEVFQKRNGDGTKIIKQILDELSIEKKLKPVQLDAVDAYIPFWEICGFKSSLKNPNHMIYELNK